MSHGPYGKGLSFERGRPDQWKALCREFPEAVKHSSNKYACWEIHDPEKWVPYGYAVIRVDSRGAGRSPGYMDYMSNRETRDYYNCIEWAGTQSWSNGKIGLSGISYYAMNQWQVASLQPPHLAAICPWEGASDWYRDATHHGGILSLFFPGWYEHRSKLAQYGVGQRGLSNDITGSPAFGDETIAEGELVHRRANLALDVRSNPLIDAYYLKRLPDWSRITVPLLSAGNWGGHGVHLRGNTEGYVRAASPQKWLEMHGYEHWAHFYTDYGRELQKQFFDHFLKGEDNGWKNRPRVMLNVRRSDDTFVMRDEHEWPLARTKWTRLYLDPFKSSLSSSRVQAEGSATYRATGQSLTFSMTIQKETEITGPCAAKLFLSSSTVDADVFVVLRAFDRGGKEVTFQGANDPQTPVARGWLRASHRRLDAEFTREYRPYHCHTQRELLTPGTIYELDVELWPTSIVLPAGYTLALTIQGRDFVYGDQGHPLDWVGQPGAFACRHDDPDDRPQEIFGGEFTLHLGGSSAAYLLLPVIPSSQDK